ncbi:MAG: M20/M25/M40 family metallo-hydrolase [Candidatus Latescibacter sp.]|nr:M20/M25/M40 family metallo-hydrolase [Candidatus Latescibacter sp.]
MIDKEHILQTCLDFHEETAAFLDRLVRFESISGYEDSAMEWLHGQFWEAADECELVPVPEEIVNDPDYAFRTDDRPYSGRPNVRAVFKGAGNGKRVILNSHVDVVPPSMGQERPFEPYIRDGALYGRGAADDKGQVAVIWTMLKVMKKLGIRPPGDVIIHLVIEEETGGNGTLAFIRRGEIADYCVIMEPCSNNIITSTRGAVWFTGTVFGQAGHPGSSQTTVSALKMAIEAMRIIEEYHDELLAKTHADDPLFLKFKNPMSVTFGQLNAGDWPAMAPQKAVFKGVFGLLTTPKEEVMRELVERVKTRGPEWLRDHCEMTFQYRHDTCRIDPRLPFVQKLVDCYQAMGVKTEIAAQPASSDTWFYTNIMKIPALSTGAGEIADCHTATEKVTLRELSVEAAIMILFLCS